MSSTIDPKPIGSLSSELKLAFTKRQACEVLAISPATLYRLEARGLIRSVGSLRTKLYAKRELERFLSNATNNAHGTGFAPIGNCNK